MPYTSKDDIKRSIVEYLEHVIDSDNFEISKLDVDGIKSKFKKVSQDKLNEALEELESEEEILSFGTNLNVYVPAKLKNHKKLKPYKLGESNISSKLVVGIIATVIIISMYPKSINQLDFSDIKNILANSILIGLIVPFILGHILNIIYQKTYNGIYVKLKSFGIDKSGLIVIVLSGLVGLVMYIVLSLGVRRDILPSEVLAVFTAFATLGPVIIKKIQKENKGD